MNYVLPEVIPKTSSEDDHLHRIFYIMEVQVSFWRPFSIWMFTALGWATTGHPYNKIVILCKYRWLASYTQSDVLMFDKGILFHF